MKLFFAPLQGYTDCLYRRIHHDTTGGVDAYFTPFVRYDNGVIRNRDVRDLLPDRNVGVPVVPQVIASDASELEPLLDWLQHLGYERVDLNMGCPFPLQTGRGRGAALLQRISSVAAMMSLLASRKEMRVSVKMRCGMSDIAEGVDVAEMLNDFPVEMVTVHARLGVQQYKGTVNEEAFQMMMDVLHHPVVFNGDIVSVDDITRVVSRWPGLYGVMVGRGLLARPTLALEWRQGVSLSPAEVLDIALQMHDRLFDDACRLLNDDNQVLARMRAFWEYQKPLVDKKVYKRLMKTTSLRNYAAAVRTLS